MNLPPGFTLEEDTEETQVSLPKGFVLETEPEKKPSKKGGAGPVGYADAYAKYASEYDKDAAKPQIPGALRPKKLSQEEWNKQFDDNYKDKLLGIPEAALSFLTSIPAMVNALPGAAVAGIKGKDAEKEWHRLVDEKTYTPRTESGQKFVEQMGYALQPFGLAPYLAPMGPIRGRGAKKPIPQVKNIDALVAGQKAPEASGQMRLFNDVVPEVDPKLMPVPEAEVASPLKNKRQLDLFENDPVAPDVLTATSAGDVYKSTPEVEMWRDRAEGMAGKENLEMLSRENPDEFASLFKSEAEPAFAKLEQEMLAQKQQQADAMWEQRRPAIDEAVEQRSRSEDARKQVEDELLGVQQQLSSERVSKGQQRKMNRGMARRQGGALDFQSIVEAFPWFKDSKIQIPLFRGVKTDYSGPERTMPGIKGDGVYLTGDPSFASLYAQGAPEGNVRQSYVNLQNPLIVNQWDTTLDRVNYMSLEKRKAWTEQQKKKGYDGVVVKKNDGSIAEVSVFDPKNVQNAFSTPAMNSSMGRGQRGALNLEDVAKGLKNFRERWGVAVEDSVKTPISEETIKAKQELAAKAVKVENILQEKLPQFSDVATFEEALALSREAPDIKSNVYSRATAPGLNFMAAYHKNPLLRYARKLITDARGQATGFSRKYVSGPEGLSVAIQAMSKEEKVLVNQILTSLDKHQAEWTPELAARVGASEAVQKYMEAHVRAFDANWEWHKSITDKQGLEVGPKRSGYSPGVFYGAYNSLVTAPDKNGKMVVVGMIAADSPGEFMKAKEYYKQSNPESRFSAETWQAARKGFAGGQNQAFKYKNLNQMMELLGSVDGDLAKVNIKVAQDALRASTELFGLDKHNFAKKGITGNQGNKPWMDTARNAEERLNSVVKYLEDSAEYNALQKPSEELRLLMADDSTAHMTNAKSYLDDYFRNISGSYVNPIGKILNTTFDTTHFLAEQIGAHIPGFKNHIGPGNTLKLSNELKNKMAQWYMGWFNWMFTASQFAQPLQTGGPIAMLAANGIDLPYHEMSAGFIKGGTNYLKVLSSNFNLTEVDPRLQKIVDYGNNHGILDFTELERAYEGNKGKLGKLYDRTAEYSMQLGEQATRPPMFLSFVEILSKVEPDLDRVLPVAEHLTNQAMADYHKWERPLMYNGLGVLAPHAGGLTTFKHNFMGTQALLAQEAANIKKGDLSAVAPIGASMLSMLAFAGLTGTPFYDELNTIYEQIREKLTGERRSISQDFLNDLEQHWKTGVVSSILDLNMQGKFSSSNMVPDTLGQAAFPHLSGAYEIGKSFVDLAKNPNEVTASNAAVAAAPSGWKQAVRAGVKQDEEGFLLDKTGQRDVLRTPEQWKASAWTGLAPLKEAADKTKRYQNIENEKARTDAMVSLAKEWRMAIIADESPERQGEILDKYEELGGNPRALIQQIAKIKMEADKTSDERLRGTPKSPQSIRRYEAFDN